MKIGTFLVVAGLAWTITTTITGAVLAYVVSIEHRLTRLETRDSARQVARPRPTPEQRT